MKMLLLALAGTSLFFMSIACSDKNIAAEKISAKQAVDSVSNMRFKKDTVGRIIYLETDLEISTWHFYKDSVLYREFSKTAERVVFEFRGRSDTKGRLQQGVTLSSYNINSPDRSLRSFEYNEEGYLVKAVEDFGKDGIYLQTYEYRDGDMISISSYFNGVLRNVKKLEYTSLNNQLRWDDYRFGHNINGWLGYNSLHLVKSITSVKTDGKVNYTLRFDYRMDERGLLLAQQMWQGSILKEIRSFFYTPETV
ncbi:MAG: hypothetical protein QM731_20170 [Chitinophagaceae bacterium]